MDDQNEDQKRRMAGMCCYNCLGLTATAAFICATMSYAYCDFLTRTVKLTEGNTVESVCASNGFDASLGSTCEALLNDHGVGFEGFWVTIPVDVQVCLAYTQPTPWGFQTPEFDTKFNSARALSITGIVCGGAAWFTLMLAGCCKLDQGKIRGLACYFFLATLFQGLSLLMLRSDICTPGFFAVYFTEPGASSTTPAWMEGVNCGLSRGSNLAIAATVLWFVCSNMLHAAVVPEPLWEGPPQPIPGDSPQQDTVKDDVAADDGVEQVKEEA